MNNDQQMDTSKSSNRVIGKTTFRYESVYKDRRDQKKQEATNKKQVETLSYEPNTPNRQPGIKFSA